MKGMDAVFKSVFQRGSASDRRVSWFRPHVADRWFILRPQKRVLRVIIDGTLWIGRTGPGGGDCRGHGRWSREAGYLLPGPGVPERLCRQAADARRGGVLSSMITGASRSRSE